MMENEYFKVPVKDLPEHIRQSSVDDSICYVAGFLEEEHGAEFVQYVERKAEYIVPGPSYFLMRRKKINEPSNSQG